MQTPSFPATQSHYRCNAQDNSQPTRFHNGPSSFFATHPVTGIIRGLFLSSLLWAFLAVSIYMVYTLILSVR